MRMLSDVRGCTVVIGTWPALPAVAQSGRQSLTASLHGKSPHVENPLPSPRMSVWQDPQGTHERARMGRPKMPLLLVADERDMGLAFPHLQQK